MKANREDFKWNGILIFGKRYGRYNIALTYLTTTFIICLLFTANRILLTGLEAEYLRGILTGAFLGCTWFAFKVILHTNVLLIASPKLFALVLRIVMPKLSLIGSTDICSKFKKKTKEDGFIYVFDMQRNIIWIEEYHIGHFPEERIPS